MRLIEKPPSETLPPHSQHVPHAPGCQTQPQGVAVAAALPQFHWFEPLFSVTIPSSDPHPVSPPPRFLSALTFATVVLPFALPIIASFKRRGLKIALITLTVISLVAKFAYSYDLGAWAFFEGTMAAKAHPNLLLWNVTRFHPFYALIEARPDGGSECSYQPCSALLFSGGASAAWMSRWLSPRMRTQMLLYLCLRHCSGSSRYPCLRCLPPPSPRCLWALWPCAW